MRSMQRYQIDIDGRPHKFRLYFDPIHVAPGILRDQLFFWAEQDDELEEHDVLLQVVPTGVLYPGRSLWLGSVVRKHADEAWHLIELPPEG